MTGPLYSDLYCSVCGRKMGRKPGVAVVQGLICDNPICVYEPVPWPNEVRDSYIVAAALAGVSASQIAFASGMSRQRVYQIVDTWKSGAA